MSTGVHKLFFLYMYIFVTMNAQIGSVDYQEIFWCVKWNLKTHRNKPHEHNLEYYLVVKDVSVY